jgi:hypothetical protein
LVLEVAGDGQGGEHDAEVGLDRLTAGGRSVMRLFRIEGVVRGLNPPVEVGQHIGDPFDRMLVARAAAEGLTLVSRDASITLDDVDVLKV